MTFNNDKKFDIDLAYGQKFEGKVLEMLTDKKLEVKTERDKWAETGNICIEFSSWGKPSGIASTEADYWVHNLAIGEEVIATLIFPVERLRQAIKNMKPYTVRGGDNKASEMYLIKLTNLLKSANLLNGDKEDGAV